MEMASARFSGLAWAGAEQASRVVRKRHPTCTFGYAYALLALLFSCWGVAAAEQDPANGYRLAGTLLVGDEFVGFLELPQGGQVLVRNGSVVNGGRVIAFDARILRIQFPDRTVELPLENSGKPPPPDARNLVTSRQDSGDGRAYFRKLNLDQLGPALQPEVSGVEKPSTGAKQHTGKPAGGDATAVLARRFGPAFQLPLGASVTRVNDKPVTTVDAAVRDVEGTLTKYGVAILNIKTSTGEARVYLERQKALSSP